MNWPVSCPELPDQDKLVAFSRDLQRLYAELQAELDELGVRCELSGRCCRFATYGHQLFVSWLEAYFVVRRLAPPSPPSEGRCPYQQGNLCSVHTDRPLGCRVFFCDPAFQQRMQDLSERYLDRLKKLYQAHGIPWRYGPWHAMLQAVLEAEGERSEARS